MENEATNALELRDTLEGSLRGDKTYFYLGVGVECGLEFLTLERGHYSCTYFDPQNESVQKIVDLDGALEFALRVQEELKGIALDQAKEEEYGALEWQELQDGLEQQAALEEEREFKGKFPG